MSYNKPSGHWRPPSSTRILRDLSDVMKKNGAEVHILVDRQPAVLLQCESITRIFSLARMTTTVERGVEFTMKCEYLSYLGFLSIILNHVSTNLITAIDGNLHDGRYIQEMLLKYGQPVIETNGWRFLKDGSEEPFAPDQTWSGNLQKILREIIKSKGTSVWLVVVSIVLLLYFNRFGEPLLSGGLNTLGTTSTHNLPRSAYPPGLELPQWVQKQCTSQCGTGEQQRATSQLRQGTSDGTDNWPKRRRLSRKGCRSKP